MKGVAGCTAAMNHEIKWVLSCMKNMDYLSDSTKNKMVSYAKTLKGYCDSYPLREKQEQQRKRDLLQSPRQKTVYDLRCQGFTADQIAERMNCCVRTVRRVNKEITTILEGGC